MGVVLLLLVILLLAGSLPVWPYSRGWGTGYYLPSALGVVLLIILVLILLGAIPHGVGTHPHYW